MNLFLASLRLCGILLLLTLTTLTQTIPYPKDTLGFTPGDDRKLASWSQVVDYFKKLDAASDRVIFEEIGKTTMGAPFVYATISSAENLKNLDVYKTTNERLADPRRIANPNNTAPKAVELLRDAQARQLIKRGKTIVLITCGIHSTEVGGYLSSMLIAHKLASSNEPEIKKILENTIILIVPSLNPDGVDIVKNWYDKTLGTPYEGTSPPELYHKYVGHDNNRDWYAFTQVETQLTVDKIHNVWHPQIVHDIHQQGENGSRLFLPPYMQPVEPNVPKQIVEGYTELGNYMAKTLRDKGFQGITTNSTYDAWTPARAYSHYHGGVRILSETASARIASPITVNFESGKSDALRRPDGTAEAVTLTAFAKKESDNFGPVWKGGEWKLSNITDYMTTAAFSLLNHAADNRERWLSRFYEIGKEAVRPRKQGELFGFIINDINRNYEKYDFEWALEKAGVEIKQTSEGMLVRMDQPYGNFAKAILEEQKYPDLTDSTGQPIAPYDVTAHSLALLQGSKVKAVYAPFRYGPPSGYGIGHPGGCRVDNGIGLYKSYIPSMDEGWTRWSFCKAPLLIHRTDPVLNERIRAGELSPRFHTIIFPDQSPNQILNGYPKGSMPDEYTGGVGKEGVENLRKFVEAGGTLVFLNRSSDFAIEQFKLPVKNITRGLPREDFYIPGSILRTELDTTHPIAKGMPQQSIAWFEQSPAFEFVRVTPSGVPPNEPDTLKTPEGVTLTYRIIARYPSDPKQILLSGWALGAEKIAGKAALVEFTLGKGKIVLFGFRPQYRGQSLATFPLLFNAISQ